MGGLSAALGCSCGFRLLLSLQALQGDFPPNFRHYDHDNPETQRHLIDVTKWWLKEVRALFSTLVPSPLSVLLPAQLP